MANEFEVLTFQSMRKPKTVGNYDILQALSNNKVTVHSYLLLGFAMLPAQKLGGKHLLLLDVIDLEVAMESVRCSGKNYCRITKSNVYLFVSSP